MGNEAEKGARNAPEKRECGEKERRDERIGLKEAR
jgi:hypothetical protein